MEYVDKLSVDWVKQCQMILRFVHSPSLSLNYWNHASPSLLRIITIRLNWMSVEMFWVTVQNSAIVLNFVKACSWFSICQSMVGGVLVDVLAIPLVKLSNYIRKHKGKREASQSQLKCCAHHILHVHNLRVVCIIRDSMKLRVKMTSVLVRHSNCWWTGSTWGSLNVRHSNYQCE